MCVCVCVCKEGEGGVRMCVCVCVWSFRSCGWSCCVGQGRYMQNALLNTDLETNYTEALREMGYSLENLYGQVCPLRNPQHTNTQSHTHTHIARALGLRTGARPRAGQRRPGSPRRLLPRLHGDAGPARVGLWHPVQLRHLPVGGAGRCGGVRVCALCGTALFCLRVCVCA